MSWEEHIPENIKNLYEVHDHRHAAAILSKEFPNEFEDLMNTLKQFRFTKVDVSEPGGNESKIPKRFSELLRPIGWVERKLNAKLVVDEQVISHDSHKVDYIKGRVAFDLEWNSKDQTFDRDLYAFRAFFEYNRISLGVLVTRSNELDPWIQSLGTIKDRYGTTRKVSAKYGASTTHMRKLIPRLEARRSGGCPVLVLGITTKLLAIE